MATIPEYPKLSYKTELEFITDLSNKEAHHFFNNFKITITQQRNLNQVEHDVAHGYCSQILLAEGWKAGYTAAEIFQHNELSAILGEGIYDFQNDDFIPEVRDFYGDELTNTNIFFLSQLHMTERFRKQGLGKKILKDIYEKLSSVCGVVIFLVQPPQFEEWGFSNIEDANKYMAEMRWDKLGMDPEMATYKLYAYFQSLGFENILGNHYFFAPPAYCKNRKGKLVFE